MALGKWLPLPVPQFPLLEDWANTSPYLREVRRIRWVNCKVLPLAPAHGEGFLHRNTLAHIPPHHSVDPTRPGPQSLCPCWVPLGSVPGAVLAPRACSQVVQLLPLPGSRSSWGQAPFPGLPPPGARVAGHVSRHPAAPHSSPGPHRLAPSRYSGKVYEWSQPLAPLSPWHIPGF